MGNIVENLKKYLEKTPEEELRKHWVEVNNWYKGAFPPVQDDCCNITRETLLAGGWEENDDFGDMRSFYTKEYDVGEHKFYLTVSPYSNTTGRRWNVFVENDRFEGVASLDVSTFDQIDELLNLCIPIN